MQVWRGGASIFMSGLLKAFGDRKRTVHLVDSFEGLPKASTAFDSDKWSKMDYLKVPLVGLSFPAGTTWHANNARSIPVIQRLITSTIYHNHLVYVVQQVAHYPMRTVKKLKAHDTSYL